MVERKSCEFLHVGIWEEALKRMVAGLINACIFHRRGYKAVGVLERIFCIKEDASSCSPFGSIPVRKIARNLSFVLFCEAC